MKNFLIICSLLVSSLAWGSLPKVALKGSDGKTYDLQKLKGKTVVLEWYNEGCPFVRKFYDAKAMQEMQKDLKKNKDVVWLTVASSAKGRQGYIANVKQAQETFKREKMMSDALVLDSDGTLGKALAAKTTPHMFVINKDGMIAYNGAIDSINSTAAKDIKVARPLFKEAAQMIADGKEMAFSQNKPYGCSVKY